MKTSIVVALSALSLTFGLAASVLGQEPSQAPAAAADLPLSEPFVISQQTAFQTIALDPELVRQSMQARAEYEDLNRKIMARQTKLCEENPKIKDLQVKMRDIQAKIDAILEQDAELKKLKEDLQSVSPEMPMGPIPSLPPAAPPAAQK